MSAEPYRHRSESIWEGAFLWSAGFTPSHTESAGDRVIFVWPAYHDGQVEAALRAYRAGEPVDPHSFRRGYYTLRGMLTAVQDAAAR